MKLQSKILKYTLPLILIPFLLMAFAVYYFIVRANQVRIEEGRRQTLNETVARFAQELDLVKKDMTLLSNVPGVVEYLENTANRENAAVSTSAEVKSEDQAKTVLDLFFKQNPYYLELSLVDRFGHERIKFSRIPGDHGLRVVKNESYYLRTLIIGTVQTPVREINPGTFSTTFTQSIKRNEFLGMIILVLNTKVFERNMRPLVKQNLETFLFDDRGIVLASVFSSADKKSLVNDLKLKKLAPTFLADSNFDDKNLKVSNGQTDYNATFLPSESFVRIGPFAKQSGTNWFLGVLEPEAVGFVPTGFQVFFFSLVFAAVGAVFFLAAKASRYITDPLEKVSRATGKIARGETDLKLDIKTGDEVEDLANSVMQMNEDLKGYQKQLLQSAKLASMGEMTSEISHEIQNRISGISLWLQHLDSEIEPDDPRQEYLDEMKLGLVGFMQMLASLKQYYKTPILNLKDTDLNLLIVETLPFIEEKIKQKQIKIYKEFSNDLLKVKADEEKLKSVILNLLLNAVEATENKGEIVIKTRQTDGTVLFAIKDTGKGIEEENLSRIFYPFFSKKSGGSGLGLAISSNIVSAHKGRIEVESEVGKGAEFKVFLPLDQIETTGNYGKDFTSR